MMIGRLDGVQPAFALDMARTTEETRETGNWEATTSLGNMASITIMTHALMGQTDTGTLTQTALLVDFSGSIRNTQYAIGYGILCLSSEW